MTNFWQKICPFQNFNEFFVAIVYFVQGAGSITAVAGSLILREELGLDFYQIGLVGAAAVIPWSIKPLYGLLTDLLPIGGYRRRPYLHAGPLIAAVGFGYLALYSHDFASFLLPLVIANIGLGLTDVATDGFIVEQSSPKNAARLQGITQASIRVAAFITSFFSGLLIFREVLTPHQMYLIQAALPLLTFAASFFIMESKVSGQKEKEARKELSLPFIASMLAIFVAIIWNLLQPEMLPSLLGLPALLISATLWGSFFIWMGIYFLRLKKLGLTTGMLFIAMLFILLWRFNPAAGSPMFFYLKDELLIATETLGFADTASQIASVLAVILAVKIFDRFRLKPLLFWTVLFAALFGGSAFALTRPEIGTALGSNLIIDWLGTLIALPVYFFEMLFSAIFGDGWQPFWQTATSLPPLVKFLYLTEFIGAMLFMLAYIPLLKLAVLITPKQAEATNFAMITSVMNIGLALTAWASGWLYAHFLPAELAATAIHLPTIELLIWINIATSLSCLLVWPWLRERKKVEGGYLPK